MNILTKTIINYRAAKEALAESTFVDEAKEWIQEEKQAVSEAYNNSNFAKKSQAYQEAYNAMSQSEKDLIEVNNHIRRFSKNLKVRPLDSDSREGLALALELKQELIEIINQEKPL